MLKEIRGDAALEGKARKREYKGQVGKYRYHVQAEGERKRDGGLRGNMKKAIRSMEREYLEWRGSNEISNKVKENGKKTRRKNKYEKE